MLQTTKIKRNSLPNYEKYLISCDKIKNQEVVNLKTLQRLLYPFARTTLLNNTVLSYKLKSGSVGVSITHVPKNEMFPHYFIVKLSNKPNLEIQLSAVNLKELMRKINHTYKFLKPKCND